MNFLEGEKSENFSHDGWGGGIEFFQSEALAVGRSGLKKMHVQSHDTFTTGLNTWNACIQASMPHGTDHTLLKGWS